MRKEWGYPKKGHKKYNRFKALNEYKEYTKIKAHVMPVEPLLFKNIIDDVRNIFKRKNSFSLIARKREKVDLFVFELYYIHGWLAKEIGQELGITEAGMSQRIKCMNQKIKRFLSHRYELDELKNSII